MPDSERIKRLSQQISALWEQHDFETRVEEKWRLKKSIDQKNIDLDQLLIASKNSLPTPAKRIHSDRLPTVKGKFFGRRDELKLLDEAWAESDTRIIQFTASGGTGKTKLIRHWLDMTEPEHIIAWSFYSQGSSEDKQTSATPFFSHVFEVLNAEKRLETDFVSPEAKGEYVAQLLNQQRCVLVLDGLEPMQYADKANRGELKDRALRALLKNLAGSSTGLCIITTRIAVHELCDRAHVISHDLHNLALEDGVQLLESLGVKGRKDELERAVTEYGCHALALSLLGNLLRIRYQGDVHKRLTLKALITTSKNRENQQAFKVMQAYAEYFDGQTELALLSLLGLFDHPIEVEVLRVLWEAQITELTAGIDEGDWWEAIESLRHEYQLLAERVGDVELDCHPLIREYFGKRLEEGQPEAWRQAHTRLYEYYKNLPEKEFPDTLEEMQPLFKAVIHGCAAGKYESAFKHIYWKRISRKDRYFTTNKLGAFSEELAILSKFFHTYWRNPTDRLSDYWRLHLLNLVGYRLSTLGRLYEALEAINVCAEGCINHKEYEKAALNLSNLSNLYLTLGFLGNALAAAKDSLNYSELAHSKLRLKKSSHDLANVYFLKGDLKNAIYYYRRCPEFESHYGFRYCSFLVADKKIEQALSILEENLHILQTDEALYKALNKLVIAQAYLELIMLDESLDWVQQSVIELRSLGDYYHLPYSLLVRAKILCHIQNYPQFYNDLQEVYDIAEPSGMRLHLTDYHLEMARLLIAEGKAPLNKIQEHVDKAAKLINDTGYHRRDKELAELIKLL